MHLPVGELMPSIYTVLVQVDHHAFIKSQGSGLQHTTVVLKFEQYKIGYKTMRWITVLNEKMNACDTFQNYIAMLHEGIH